MKERLFSVTRDMVRWDTFRSGGPGGQNQNKVETGVRCTHASSGAVGESREYNSQWKNKQAAWRRMGQSAQFQSWARREAARLTGQPSISWTPSSAPISEVIAAMQDEKNCRVEVNDGFGWTEVA